MKSRKAEFRATRETLGISTGKMAHIIGWHDSKSIQKIESASNDREPYDDQLEKLMSRKRAFDAMVAQSADAVYAVIDEASSEPQTVQLTYWQTQEQYDLYGRDPGSFALVNAVSRAVAIILTYDGIEVEWAYPMDAHNIHREEYIRRAVDGGDPVGE